MLIILFLSIHVKLRINRNIIELRTNSDIPQLRISVDSFLMSSYLQGEVLSTLSKSSTFFKWHGLPVEISSVDDISTIAATLRKHCNHSLQPYGKIYPISKFYLTYQLTINKFISVQLYHKNSFQSKQGMNCSDF